MSYVEQLQRIEAGIAAQPPRQYLSNEEWRSQRTALTRARNSGDFGRVLRAVEKAVARWNETTWPDDWSTFRIALEDAASAAARIAFEASREADYDKADEYDALAKELHAASRVLFRA